MNWINGTQAKKLIKALGFDVSKVSCTTRRGSYSLNVQIHDLSIPLEPIQEALAKFENIRRCEYSGEILEGGNRFVFVQYDWQTQPTEELVDLYTLVLTSNGHPKTTGDCYHFVRRMMSEAPHLTESQCGFGFSAIYRRT